MALRLGSLLLLALAAVLLAPRPAPSFAPDVKPSMVKRQEKEMRREERMAALEEVLGKNHSEVLLFLADCNDSKVHHMAMEKSPPAVALQVYDQMCQQRSEPDALALRLALKACAQLKNAAELRKLVDQLEKLQCWSSPRTVDMAFVAAKAAGEVTTAARILDQMASKRLPVQAQHLESAIAAAARREPPSPGAANYFMQELMKKAPVVEDAARDLLEAQRNLPLSLRMSCMRSMLMKSNRTGRPEGPLTGKFRRTGVRRAEPGHITPKAGEVMLASVLGQMPHEVNRTQLSQLPRKQRTALASLMDDFRSAGVTLPARSQWIVDWNC